MRTYGYLYGKMLKNRIRKLFSKPASVIYVIFFTAYFGWLAYMLNGVMMEGSFGTKENLVRILAMITIYFTPANYVSYARRKGLLFLPGDVHFLFGSPASPKMNLIYVYGKTLLSVLIMGILMLGAGVFWFHVEWWRMLLYGFVFSAVDSILQGSIVILLYGNEKMGTRGNRFFSIFMYGLLACFVLVGAYIFWKNGMHWKSVLEFFDREWITMIPLIGWELAVMRLLILGPTTINVVCSILYVLSFILLVFLAWKMPCTGQYYEDAMKFADDYQEARKKSKKGEVAVVGKKKMYRNAQVVYKGNGAKAIFYRQLLEYKKERFFIFGFVTLLYLAGGIFIGYLGIKQDFASKGIMKYYLIPGVMAYLSFIMSSYRSKWEKELENPYVFLIPESPFWKLFYATCIDHIRAGIHGFLLAFPAIIGLGVELWYLPVYIFVMIGLNALNIYSSTVCTVIFGRAMSENMIRFLRMFMVLFIILLAIPGTVIATIWLGIWAGMTVLVVYTLIFSGLLAWAGSRCFARMEG